MQLQMVSMPSPATAVTAKNQALVCSSDPKITQGCPLSVVERAYSRLFWGGFRIKMKSDISLLRGRTRILALNSNPVANFVNFEEFWKNCGRNPTILETWKWKVPETNTTRKQLNLAPAEVWTSAKNRGDQDWAFLCRFSGKSPCTRSELALTLVYLV